MFVNMVGENGSTHDERCESRPEVPHVVPDP